MLFVKSFFFIRRKAGGGNYYFREGDNNQVEARLMARKALDAELR